MQMMAPTFLRTVGVCMRGTQIQVCMCVTVPNPRLAVALDMRDRKDQTSAHILA